jgi:hypothetical protein
MMTLWWGWILGLLVVVCWYNHNRLHLIWQQILFVIGLTIIRVNCAPLQRHSYEGHEAEYIRYFLLEKFPNEGDTSCYPAMQIIWYFLGWLCSSFPMAPIWVASCLGSASLILIWYSLSQVFNLKKERWLLLFWLVTIPLHWGWSLSAYNVIFPFFFVTLAFSSLISKRSTFEVAAYLAIVVAMRIEFIVVCIPFYYWYWQDKQRNWYTILLFILPGLSLLGMLQSIIPGEGERLLAFSINWNLLGYHSPYHLLWPALIVGGLIGFKTHRHFIFGAVILIVVNHLVMATFDDYASRHTLVTVLSFAILVTPLLSSKLGTGLMLLLCTVHLYYCNDLRMRWYAEPEEFNRIIKEEYPMLPIINIQEAREDQCAWIVEEDVFAAEPVRSHFNLLDPMEVESMFMEHSCIDWCLTVQDWRWSSLGVQDRAYRIKAMYLLEEKAIVKAGDQSCLQLRIGKPIIAIK